MDDGVLGAARHGGIVRQTLGCLVGAPHRLSRQNCNKILCARPHTGRLWLQKDREVFCCNSSGRLEDKQVLCWQLHEPGPGGLC